MVHLEGLLVPQQGLDGSTFTLAASGPAFEEIVNPIGSAKVSPGRFDLSGSIHLLEDAVRFADVTLERDHGELSANIELSRSESHPWMKFDLRAQGSDLSGLISGTERIAINEMPYSAAFCAHRA